MRQRVLACFRQLHRARQQVFAGDLEALAAGRQKINEEFAEHKNETDPDNIIKFIKRGEEATEYLKTMVLQASLNTETGRYEVKFQKETTLLKNIPFDENWEPPKRSKRKKKDGCGES